jgi:hypothetical protein
LGEQFRSLRYSPPNYLVIILDIGKRQRPLVAWSQGTVCQVLTKYFSPPLLLFFLRSILFLQRHVVMRYILTFRWDV